MKDPATLAFFDGTVANTRLRTDLAYGKTFIIKSLDFINGVGR